MKTRRLALAVLGAVALLAHAQNKGTPLGQTGVPAPMMFDTSDPISLSYPCDTSHLGIPFYNMTAGTSRPLWLCNGTNWVQAATSVPVNGSGTPLSEKCIHTSVQSNTSGAWSTTWTSLGSTVSLVNVTSIGTAATVAGTNNAAINSVSPTGASGIVLTYGVLNVLGVNVTIPLLSTAATTVYIEVCATP